MRKNFYVQLLKTTSQKLERNEVHRVPTHHVCTWYWSCKSKPLTQKICNGLSASLPKKMQRVNAVNHGFSSTFIVSSKSGVFLESQKGTLECKSCELSLFYPQWPKTLNLVLYTSNAKASVFLLHSALGTSVNATLSGEPTLRSATGSQTQVPTLTLTWKTSHFPFCSDSQDIFLLNHEENHPLKQDSEAAAVIVFITVFPSGCGMVGGVEEQLRLTEKENGSLYIFWDDPPPSLPKHDHKCLSLSHSDIYRSMRQAAAKPLMCNYCVWKQTHFSSGAICVCMHRCRKYMCICLSPHRMHLCVIMWVGFSVCAFRIQALQK